MSVMNEHVSIKFKNTILELGSAFYDEVVPAKFPQKIIRFQNRVWAERLGFAAWTQQEWIQHFGEFLPCEGSLRFPLALRYHGHQFRHYNPDLGDGRGFLYAQLEDPQTGLLYDLGTKGSGQTPYSRQGDGRLTLKGGVREVLATEFLEALGVNTSKTFSLIETGESLQRNDEPSPTRSSVLVRLSHGHIRFGTFQRLHALGDTESSQKLIDYCLQHLLNRNELLSEASQVRAEEFFFEVCRRTASLAASWMIAGFVHGVLNTDNMNITGESFDYGPYRFLPHYDPGFTAAYFDQSGLYCFGRQPEACVWNLDQLARSLASVADYNSLRKGLSIYAEYFNGEVLNCFFRRLGLLRQDSVLDNGKALDSEVLHTAFEFLQNSEVSYAQFFFDFYGGVNQERVKQSPCRDFYQGEVFNRLERLLNQYLSPERVELRLKDMYFQQTKPTNLLIDEIEEIWEAIAARDDWSLFQNKVEELQKLKELMA